MEEMLKECEKNAGADSEGVARLGRRVPDDYAEFLLRSNGLAGFVSAEQYVILWRAEELPDLNEAYAVREFLPHATLVGTDGGDTGYGYDLETKRYLRVPLVGMSPETAEDMGGSFEQFVARLAT